MEVQAKWHDILQCNAFEFLQLLLSATNRRFCCGFHLRFHLNYYYSLDNLTAEIRSSIYSDQPLGLLRRNLRKIQISETWHGVELLDLQANKTLISVKFIWSNQLEGISPVNPRKQNVFREWISTKKGHFIWAEIFLNWPSRRFFLESLKKLLESSSTQHSFLLISKVFFLIQEKICYEANSRVFLDT